MSILPKACLSGNSLTVFCFRNEEWSTFEYNNWPKYCWIPSTNTEAIARYVKSVKKPCSLNIGPSAIRPSSIGPASQITFIWQSYKRKEPPDTIKLYMAMSKSTFWFHQSCQDPSLKRGTIEMKMQVVLLWEDPCICYWYLNHSF